MRVCSSKQRTKCAIVKSDGTSYASVDETLNRWRENYETVHYYAPADTCPDLDTQSATVTPSPDIFEDEPTVLDKVQKAIRKLKNGRAVGPDGIPPELLKYDE